MNELTIGDKIYVSSKRAAEITGYAKDYVGQLCREGHVDAKMVGRSWYVLESSIREHRFGKQEEESIPDRAVAPAVPTAPEVSLPATWEPSTYIKEPVLNIPTIIPAAKAPEPARYYEITNKNIEISEEEPALSEMQSAWREWFDTRNEPFAEIPEVEKEEIDPEPEEAAPVRIQTIEKPYRAEVADIVPIRVAPEPVVTISPPMPRRPEPVAKSRRTKRAAAGSNMVAIALLVVLAGASIAITLVSTGYVGPYINDNPVMRFLGGTRTISK